MGHRHRATHRDRDLTTQPATARPGNLDVEEPAQAGRTPMPTNTLPPRPTEITAHESTAVDQGSDDVMSSAQTLVNLDGRSAT